MNPKSPLDQNSLENVSLSASFQGESVLVCIRGAGDLASGVGVRLWQAGYHRLVFLERAQPLAVRRLVSFSEAVYQGSMRLEHEGEVFDALCLNPSPGDCAAAVARAHESGKIVVLVDPQAQSLAELQPRILIDAILAKRNLGTYRGQAGLVIGLGPGFVAHALQTTESVDVVIETQRGENLGMCIYEGSAEANTGIPAAVLGFSTARVVRSPARGLFESTLEIGAAVQAGECVAMVAGEAVLAGITGVLRGFLRPGVLVDAGTKVGDVEPRPDYPCTRISDKALRIGAGVCAAVRHFEMNF